MKKLQLLFLTLAFSLTACNPPTTPTPVPPASTGTTNVVTTPTVPTVNPADTFILNNGPLIQTAASVATGAILDFAVQQSSTRTKLANEIYASANALNSLATGQIPTQQQVHDAIVNFGGNGTDAQYVQYATALSAVYGNYVNSLGGNSKAAVALLSDLALGAQSAASVYITPVPVS